MTTLHEHPSTAIVDTLRMTDKDLQRILSTLPASMEATGRFSGGGGGAGVGGAGGNGRGALTNLPRMVARLQSREGGGWITHLIKPREIHAHGLRFYFGQFVHEGNRCMVLLRDLRGKAVQLTATVASCRHLHGRIHEITATFDRPITPEHFQFPDGSPVAERKTVSH